MTLLSQGHQGHGACYSCVVAYVFTPSAGRDSLSDFSHDWAVIRFSDNSFTQKTGWFGNAAYQNDVRNAGKTVVGQQANHIGYSADIQRGAIPSGHFGCQLQQVDQGVVLHTPFPLKQ